MNTQRFEMEYGGRTLVAELSDIADQSNGSAIVRYGETVVFASAVMGEERAGLDYFPLTVNYEERFYAAGKILGSRFMRREGRPSDEAILTSRLIDRTIRPLFNQHIRREVQVVVYALALDDENDTDIPALVAASLALGVSDIPWDGPIGAVRIGWDGSEYRVNPGTSERGSLKMEMVVCGRSAAVNMIEASAHEAEESVVAGALGRATEEIKRVEEFQKNVVRAAGRAKADLGEIEPPEAVVTMFQKDIAPALELALFVDTQYREKQRALARIRDEWRAKAKEALGAAGERWADAVYESGGDSIVHNAILDAEKGNERRVDGRGLDDIRPLYAGVDLFARNHGTGVFFRGGTHIFSVVTLGGPKDSLLIEGMEVQEAKRFMHHYNFPPFSTGEAGRMGSPGRREIGHGALVEKALLPVIPPKDEFPYTIRVVSECMASSGSTSQGSVCASTLALMDAGVPIKAPVAGIAIGLVYRPGDGSYKILTDIQGLEDHFTDMDFKVAGTRVGITAIQMDVKVPGVPIEILAEALDRGKAARAAILDRMAEAIESPRTEMKPSAPRILKIVINPEKIGDVIGPSGRVIKRIVEETGAEIDVEQDGSVFITAVSKRAAEAARECIERIVHEFRPGEVIAGRVIQILDFGAIVELGPGKDGMVHISELAPDRVEKVEDVVHVGDTVNVQVIEVGDRGRVSLSIKRLNPRYDPAKDARTQNHGRRPPHRGRRG